MGEASNSFLYFSLSPFKSVFLPATLNTISIVKKKFINVQSPELILAHKKDQKEYIVLTNMVQGLGDAPRNYIRSDIFNSKKCKK